MNFNNKIVNFRPAIFSITDLVDATKAEVQQWIYPLKSVIFYALILYFKSVIFLTFALSFISSLNSYIFFWTKREKPSVSLRISDFLLFYFFLENDTKTLGIPGRANAIWQY